MVITFKCSCGKAVKADEQNAGKRAKCPACGAVLTIPKPVGAGIVTSSLPPDDRPDLAKQVFTLRDGNPIHIAKVREIAAAAPERMRAELPDAYHKVVNEERAKTIYGLQGGGGRDPRDAAFVKALISTTRWSEIEWRKWRNRLSEPLDVSGADFSGLSFLGIDFSSARMAGVNFAGSIFYQCSFRLADLDGANFANVETTFRGPGLLFDGAKLARASFSGAAIFAASFKGANLVRANFSGATLEGPFVDARTDFTGAIFTGCAVKKFDDGSGGDLVKSFRRRLSEEQRKQLKAGCFVATAACGDANAWEVLALREFRERVLAPNAIGRLFVEAYYLFSPPFASFISRWPLVRIATRTVLIRPLARSAHRLMQRTRACGRG